MSGNIIYFCFANPAGFSGQKAATEIIIKGLAQRGWTCVRHPQPVLDRASGGLMSLVFYALALLRSWLRSLSLLGARGAWLHVNLGQTTVAFLRDLVPLLVGRSALGREHIVISLHGSPFMTWERHSFRARFFHFILNQAGRVTVLGERQRHRLIELGLPPARVSVLVNTCRLDNLTPTTKPAQESHAPLRILYLSSLIDTKGYPEYLDALALLAERDGPPLEAVLCGKITASEFSVRFPEHSMARQWIEARILEINRSNRVHVRWIEGETGAAKTKLYQNADIFVLPTYYAVEAQPLVLLEAMAAGCAIITTKTGEIETILDSESARFVSPASPYTIADELSRLIANPEERTRLAQNARQRFERLYSMDRHIDAWENLLSPPPTAHASPYL